MITVTQIKAARALLDWNQLDLARAAGLSKPALANVERGSAVPRPETMTAIKTALEQAGIEFTDGPGVRLAHEKLNVEIFRGHDSIARLWHDVLHTLRRGEERLIGYVQEDKYLANTGAEFKTMMQKYKKAGIKGRILSRRGDTNFSDFTSEYRWVPETRFLDVPYYVYGNKYAVLLWNPSPRVIVIENKILADNYRTQFNRHWEAAEKPRKQTK